MEQDETPQQKEAADRDAIAAVKQVFLERKEEAINAILAGKREYPIIPVPGIGTTGTVTAPYSEFYHVQTALDFIESPNEKGARFLNEAGRFARWAHELEVINRNSSDPVSREDSTKKIRGIKLILSRRQPQSIT